MALSRGGIILESALMIAFCGLAFVKHGLNLVKAVLSGSVLFSSIYL